MRSNSGLLAFVLAAHASIVCGQTARSPLSLLDVPYLSQSEALCGGAAAAMVMRYWGEREIAATSFAHLVEAKAGGIRTDALVADLRRRGWEAIAAAGNDSLVRDELSQRRPVIALIEDRPSIFHFVVIVGWHERGVVFHDPARAPFQVMTRNEFDRRWAAAHRWIGVVVPARALETPPPLPIGETPSALRRDGAAPSSCDALVSDGVRAAQANDLEAAERSLAAALSCPGADALRELAGVRLLQKRWNEVSDLATAAVTADPRDAYAWKLLGTARFIQDDRTGALDAWNRAGEPRLDLVRIDGLSHTRYAIVERLLDVESGVVLTPATFGRARRALAELPSAASTRLEYTPVGSGLAELRGAVSERPLVPSSPIALGVTAVAAVATREVRVPLGSLTGGGERTTIAWRFWNRRPRIALAVDAPAPWGGVWGVEASQESQAFSAPAFDDAERWGVRLGQSSWASDTVRWNVTAGIDRWRDVGQFGVAGGGVRLASRADRLDARIQVRSWLGRARFATATASVSTRSSSDPRGWVMTGMTALDLATALVPLDLWPAGDTGSVRSTLLRAHPALDHGRLRIDRLGRAVVTATGEAQRWWRVTGPLRAAGAAFVDVGRTADRLSEAARIDADVGIGARFLTPLVPGIFRIDVGRGLRDGDTVLSLVYQP